MKQTAVEQFIKNLQDKFPTQMKLMHSDNQYLLEHLTIEAKALEKEQIEDAYEKGYTEDIPYPVSGGYYKMNAEQYYNETFGKEEIIVTEYKDGTIQVETFKSE